MGVLREIVSSVIIWEERGWGEVIYDGRTMDTSSGIIIFSERHQV